MIRTYRRHDACCSNETDNSFEDVPRTSGYDAFNFLSTTCEKGTGLPDSDAVLCRKCSRGYRQSLLTDAWPESWFVSYTTNLRHGMPPHQLDFKGTITQPS